MGITQHRRAELLGQIEKVFGFVRPGTMGILSLRRGRP
jgi:hypothetical protein